MKTANLGPSTSIETEANLTAGAKVRVSFVGTVREAEGELVVDIDSVESVSNAGGGKGPKEGGGSSTLIGKMMRGS